MDDIHTVKHNVTREFSILLSEKNEFEKQGVLTELLLKEIK